MQSRLAVCVLPGIAQRLMSQGSLLRESVKSFALAGDLTKTAVMTAPPEPALFIGDIQRCAVQVGAEPVNLSPFIVSQVVNTRQRAVCLVRIINISFALPVMLLFL